MVQLSQACHHYWTVSWEGNMEESFERKKLQYEKPRVECEDKVYLWACQVFSSAEQKPHIWPGLDWWARRRTTHWRWGNLFKVWKQGPHHDKIIILPLSSSTSHSNPSPCNLLSEFSVDSILSGRTYILQLPLNISWPQMDILWLPFIT